MACKLWVTSSLITAMIAPSTRQPLGMVYVAKNTLADTNSLIAWILFGPPISYTNEAITTKSNQQILSTPF